MLSSWLCSCSARAVRPPAAPAVMVTITVMITGASGTIGAALAQALAARSDTIVVCLSRSPVELPGVGSATAIVKVQGDFANRADLDRALSLVGRPVDACVHMAAITSPGNGTEEQLECNLVGTHALVSHLAEHGGCRKFVLASSIAATGCLNTEFRPLELPIPDEHPCLDGAGYGASKYLMEELSRYLSRQNSALDIICLRIAAIVADDAVIEPISLDQHLPSSPPLIVSLGRMRMGDMLRCLELCIDRRYRPGSMQVLNAVHPCTQLGEGTHIADLLRKWWGDKDVGLIAGIGSLRDTEGVWEWRTARDELGFIAQLPVVGSSVSKL